MRIVKIENSQRKNKRLKVTLDNGEIYHFGLRDGKTYIDHHDEKKRDNYRKRHIGNSWERHLIHTLIPSPALMSWFVLWGDSTDIMENVNELNKLWEDK